MNKINPDGLKIQTINALMMACKDMDDQGIKYYISGAFRSTEFQQALYAQGRESLESVNAKRKIANQPSISAGENTYTVTNCDGIKNKSNHQSGLAVDIVPINSNGDPIWPTPGDSRWMPIIKAMKKAGFQSGSEWKNFPDWPHHEIKE